MKKILLINTKYREFGGEDSNFIEEYDFLSKNYEVDCIEFENKGRIKFSDLIAFVLNNNFISNKKVIKKINEFKPDFVYIHNTWFRGNLGLFSILKRTGIPIVHKIHNFRFDCTSSYFSQTHLNGKKFCEKCGYSNKSRILNKYFNESLLKSIAVIWYGKKYLRILKTYNMKILVMTNFQKKYLLETGVNPKNIYIFENPIKIDPILKVSYDSSSNYIIYAGRISFEKGLEQLIESWIDSDTKDLVLKVVGTGSSLESLKKQFPTSKLEFLGQIPNEEVVELIKKSRAVVTATRMYEGQPKFLCEASIYGIPAIFPSFGGMIEFYQNDYQLKFEQYNYSDLINKFNLLENKQILKKTSDDVSNFIAQKLSEKSLNNKFKEIIKNFDE